MSGALPCRWAVRMATTRAQFAYFPGECLKPETRWRSEMNSNSRSRLSGTKWPNAASSVLGRRRDEVIAAERRPENDWLAGGKGAMCVSAQKGAGRHETQLL